MHEAGPAAATHDMMSTPLVSVVIPAFNERQNIRPVVAAVTEAVAGCGVELEVIIVDDGSADGTFDEVRHHPRTIARLEAIRLSRNFGKEAALFAGLCAATGCAVITMDADLQHPPALIPELIARWRAGAQVVNAVKGNRRSDPWVVRQRAAAFNALAFRLTGIDIENSADFKLLDRVVVDTLVQRLPERGRFYRGLTSWLGYRTEAVPFTVASRAHGDAKMSLRRVLALANVAIIAFTAAPLRIVTFLGVLTLAFAGVVAADALISWLRGDAVSGFATLVITESIYASFVMISLGIIGEYIAKIYEEVKRRPIYLIGAQTSSPPLEIPPADRATSRNPRTHSRKSKDEVA